MFSASSKHLTEHHHVCWVTKTLQRIGTPQSRQSAKLFSPIVGIGTPSPSGGGAHSLAREGVGEFQFRQGDIHCGTLYIYVYFVRNTYAYTLDQYRLTNESQRKSGLQNCSATRPTQNSVPYLSHASKF